MARPKIVVAISVYVDNVYICYARPTTRLHRINHGNLAIASDKTRQPPTTLVLFREWEIGRVVIIVRFIPETLPKDNITFD